MFRFFISFLFIMAIGQPAELYGQAAGNITQDSIRKSEEYGLRVGIDLSRPLIATLNEDYSGIELVGDYRLSYKFYLAAELGNESKTTRELLDNEQDINIISLYDYEASGSYLKVGVDYNTYENWYGMNNSLFVGARYAFSAFSNTLNSYSLYDSNRYWNPGGFVTGSDQPQEFSGLNASWLELLLGVKAEIIANFYLGASVRLGLLITNKESEVFPNLWIPGFNRVTDGSSFGVGFNYTLTYFLPLYKKTRVAPKPREEQ
ncbi:DUF6048 family protein [Robiginitalea sp. IMCC43444]|uniref:DUF6048 family protein n=1 Tax=Robiginitalea sp. IMCC43444 TaxID=3459121 RepID=UPI004041AAC7